MERVVDLGALRSARADGPAGGVEGRAGEGRLATVLSLGIGDRGGAPGGFGDSSVCDDAGGLRGRGGGEEPPGHSPRREPCVSLYDLLPRDLTVTGEIVHALLMVREVLDCALPGQNAWRGPLVALFDAAHHRPDPLDPAFSRKIEAFKHFLERFITRENARDLGTAVVILNLIARSPGERVRRAGPEAARPPA